MKNPNTTPSLPGNLPQKVNVEKSIPPANAIARLAQALERPITAIEPIGAPLPPLTPDYREAICLSWTRTESGVDGVFAVYVIFGSVAYQVDKFEYKTFPGMTHPLFAGQAPCGLMRRWAQQGDPFGDANDVLEMANKSYAIAIQQRAEGDQSGEVTCVTPYDGSSMCESALDWEVRRLLAGRSPDSAPPLFETGGGQAGGDITHEGEKI